uniref:Cytochrome P450 n=1 Tax=Fagus sylvatica TaxID=28930 RepID=A0A2N9HDZ0_FAGSY
MWLLLPLLLVLPLLFLMKKKMDDRSTKKKGLPPSPPKLPIHRIAFGKSFRGSDLDNERFQEVVHEAEAMLGSFSASEYFPFVGWIMDKFSGRFQRLERIFHELDNFFQHVIDLHLNPERKKQEHEDIIDVLLRVEREQIESGAARFTKQNIKAVLLDLFLGGVETGTITMIWAMAELAKNPKVMKKAQDEIRNYIGNKGRVSESDIGYLFYLKMVVKETLRLHPPATMLLARETMSHFKINGYDIYPQMLVQINAWAIGRDPKYWKNPEEFIPERFLNNSIDYKGQHFELLPFGAGRRGCPGIYMATTTIELALANLLYCFDWKLAYGMKEEDINMEEIADLAVTTRHKPNNKSQSTTTHLDPTKPPTPPRSDSKEISNRWDRGPPGRGVFLQAEIGTGDPDLGSGPAQAVCLSVQAGSARYPDRWIGESPGRGVGLSRGDRGVGLSRGRINHHHHRINHHQIAGKPKPTVLQQKTQN